MRLCDLCPLFIGDLLMFLIMSVVRVYLKQRQYATRTQKQNNVLSLQASQFRV
jgi:hypothetical protein